jgi:predicted metal-dependent hydrolase
MQKLIIGNKTIEYSISESEKAKLKRIIIKPETGTIIVPKGTPFNTTRTFMEKHKSRIFFKRNEQLQKMEGIKDEKPPAYVTGVKILHYGRMTALIAERRDIPFVSIEAKSRIHIQVPQPIMR